MTRRDEPRFARLRDGGNLPRVCVLREVREVVAFLFVAWVAVSALLAMGGA